MHRDIKDNTDIVSYAVENNGNALKYASTRLKDNERIVKLAIKNNSKAIKYASSRLKILFKNK